MRAPGVSWAVRRWEPPEWGLPRGTPAGASPGAARRWDSPSSGFPRAAWSRSGHRVGAGCGCGARRPQELGQPEALRPPSCPRVDREPHPPRAAFPARRPPRQARHAGVQLRVPFATAWTGAKVTHCVYDASIPGGSCVACPQCLLTACKWRFLVFLMSFLTQTETRLSGEGHGGQKPLSSGAPWLAQTMHGGQLGRALGCRRAKAFLQEGQAPRQVRGPSLQPELLISALLSGFAFRVPSPTLILTPLVGTLRRGLGTDVMRSSHP